MSRRLLSVPQVSEMLSLKPATIRKMLWRGELTAIRPTGRRAVRIDEIEVERLISGQAPRVGVPRNG